MEKRTIPNNSGQGQDLTPTQEKLIQALLQYSTVKAAADAVGIVDRAARRYMQLAAFQAAHDQAKQELLADAMELVQIEGAKSVKVIAELRDDILCPHPTRLKAAHILGSRLTDIKPLQDDTPLQGQEGPISKRSLTNEELITIERIAALATARMEKAEQDREALERKRQ